MGNQDLVIVFNKGEISFLIKGQDYETRKEAIDIGISKYGKYINMNMEYDEEFSSDIKSINIYEVWNE